MNIQDVYDLAIEMGIKSDPRSHKKVTKLLEKRKKDYQDLPEKKKKYFDLESLKNPYSDSRILVGDPKKEVKKILAGIDADGTEVLLADRLNQQGEGIDLLIGHHPEGNAYANLHEVMDLQVGVYEAIGVPINVAYSLMTERMQEIKRRIHPINHNQAVDSAKLLKMPLLTLHTIWDNLGDEFMRKYVEEDLHETVGDLYEKLLQLPEFIEAEKGKAGPSIVSGNEKSPVGKIAVFFTGGTDPSKEMHIEIAKAGIGTIVTMHMPEDTIKEMRKMHINVINTGHMSSDSIGANIFFDELEKKGIKVIPCSGLIRVKRNLKK